MTPTALSAVDLMPAPRTDHWGVHLAYQGENSDKEYRIAVLDSSVVFQWGRYGAVGQTKRLHCDGDPAAALAAARRQWAAKEAKGYWPVTGVLPLPAIDAITASQALPERLHFAGQMAADRLREVAVGDTVVIVQVPPRADALPVAAATLSSIARQGGLLEDDGALWYGQFAVLAVDRGSLAALEAVCPVMAVVGLRQERHSALLAEVALSLLGQPAPGVRSQAAQAITNARAALA
jgi:predicted DNA-binding WGR domain protein